MYAVVIKWAYLSVPQTVSSTPPGGLLFRPLLELLAAGKDSSLSLRWLGIFFNLIQAIQLNALINRQKMMGSSNYLPALSYLTISSAIPIWNEFTSWSIAASVLLWGFQAQFSLYQTPQSRGAVYNRCLVWGLLPLLEPSTYPFLIWGVIGIWVMRPFRWAECWVMLIGLLTPYYFLGIWKYWNGMTDWYRLFPQADLHLPEMTRLTWYYTGVGLLAIPTVAGMLQVQSNLRKMLIPVRKGWTHWTLWLFVAALVPFLTEGFGVGYTALLIAVAAFQACFFFYASWRIVPLLFFWMELIAVLWIQYGSRFS